MTTTSRPRSRRGSGEQLREAMLAAAADLLDTSCDVESLSVRTVTAATGVSPTALYLHFEDKAALVHAVKQRCIAALGASLRAAAEAAAPPASRAAVAHTAPGAAAEIAAPRAAASPAATLEAAAPEAAAPEVAAPEVAAPEVAAPEAAAPEVAPAEAGRAEVAPAEAAGPEVAPAEAGRAEAGRAEVVPADAAPAEAGRAEVAPAEAAAAEAVDGTRARLRAISHAYLGYATAHPGHYAMLFHITPSTDDATNEPPEDIKRTSAELFGLLVGVIAERLDEAAAFEAASGLWISLHGRAHISRAMPWFGLPDQDRYVDLLVDQILA